MSTGGITLKLAHSPDPDDAFMWWPITGKIDPVAARGALERLGAAAGALPDLALLAPPAIDTGRFRFRALPGDIETLNRRAAEVGDLEITALSARAYADVAGRYAVTACGGSFGDGYGPKVVVRAGSSIRCDACLRTPRGNPLTVAIPGMRTTAFLVFSLLMRERNGAADTEHAAAFEAVEMPFDRVIDAVARGEHEGRRIDAGLVIHEGQLTFSACGLRQVVDLGAWWKQRTGVPLPLGVNVLRRDLDARSGPGTLTAVADLLRRSVRHALEHRAESVEYALGFALANKTGGVTREGVERYIDLYVNRWTIDMGDAGRAAVERLLREGAAAGLCPDPGRIEPV